MPHPLFGCARLPLVRRDVVLGVVVDSESQDVEEVGEGVEGTVGVLGVLDAVEVVHVVAPDNEEEHPSEELQGVRHAIKVYTDTAAPKHMAR